MAIIKCNLCPEDNPFRAAHDEIGTALMHEHIRETHFSEEYHA